MITYQVEQYSDVIDEIWPMLEAHYVEIATDKAIKPFDPDLDRYKAMEVLGALRIFTARNTMEASDEPTCPGCGVEPGERHLDDCKLYAKNGQLVGYFISFVMPGLHYQQTMMAINDIMYIDPAWRGSTVGYRLIKQATEDLKNLGADVLTIHMKTDYPFRNLLIRLGFHLTEENWERVL